jgi:geranylgeranyl diphosphate synthase type II
MFDLHSYFETNRYLINQKLEHLLRECSQTGRLSGGRPGGQTGRLTDAVRYSLLGGGKRIRPILCIAAAEAVGGSINDVLTTACALEMIHAYSLIHDDLPAMDDDDMRRGKPTSHIAFDEATAILAGDALLTLAFQVLSSNPDRPGLSSQKRLEVIHIISRSAGCAGMVEGQMRDIASEGRELSLNQLKEMHALKTGAMIECSVLVGALMGNGSQDQIQHLEKYAKNIGIAFQVVDDILDIEGDPAVLGKTVGQDVFREKNTYPALMGVNQSKAFANKLVDNALQSLEHFDIESDPLRSIALYIIQRNR